MCTAITYKTRDFYFGRTLDYEFSYGERLTIAPRNFLFCLRNGEIIKSHYAIMGMAHVAENYPLFYDGINEKGLSMAGLNFVGNAFYREEKKDMNNIASFEFIPYILGKCKSVEEAKKELKKINITNTPFSEKLLPSPLHFIIADKKETITVESVKEGLKIYENPVGVLTNNPPFDMQMFNLNNYMHLSKKEPENHFSKKLDLKTYSRGMGALGLPGDSSSQSRFIRAAFIKENSISEKSEKESVGQLFHILSAVEQQRGCCEVEKGKYEITIYTSCCNANKGIYYYTTYNNRQITAVNMHNENLDDTRLITFHLIDDEQINWQN